ncbi:MAG: DUF2889 domain-containing protein [Ilumatobacter sp.]
MTMFESRFDTESILPPPPDGAEALLHDREYRIRAFRLSAERVLLQGAVRDQKPPGLYLRGDPDPLTVHHMQLSVEIAFPSLELVDVTTHFESHPADDCPTITAKYDELIGLSIGRGFTKKVAALFGGPRGCTHVTALLYAMAPVAMQCFWSMRAAGAALEGKESPLFAADGAQQDDMWRAVVNTCHIWDENGPTVAARNAGAPHTIPVFLRSRLEALGRSPEQ